MGNSNILANLKKAVLEGDDDIAQELTQKALDQDIEPMIIVNQAIIPGIQEAGELWKRNE